MNITQYIQRMSAVNFERWLSATILSVAISGFLTLIVGELSHWSATIAGVSLWLTTSFFSSWAQILVIRSSLRVQISRWVPWLFVGSILGWTISLLLVHSLIQITNVSIDSAQLGSAIWIGFLAGVIIGLFPGLFIGLTYLRLVRPDADAKRFFLNNVIGWCLGMGSAVAGVLLLLTIIVSNMMSIF